MKKYLIAITAILMPTAVFAGQAEGEACAATLSDTGKSMYQAVAPQVSPSVDLQDTMKSVLKPMVKSGALSRSDVRGNAKAVHACLKSLQG